MTGRGLGAGLRAGLASAVTGVRRQGRPVAVTARDWARLGSAAAVRLARPTGGRAAHRPVTDYNAPHYWLDYRAGFVRRGLPGAVLKAVLGRPPDYCDVARAGVVLSGAAVASVVPLAVRASSLAPGRLPALLAGTVLVLSPLTCTLLVQDTGRYDAVGVVGLGVVAAVPAASRLPLPVGAGVLAVTVAAATACEEFLLGVLAPVALGAVGLLCRRRGVPPRGTLLLAGAVLAPGALVAAASLLVPTPGEVVAAARAQALAAGVLPPGAMGDAVAAVERSLGENLAFFRLFEPRAVVGSLALWSGLYGLTAVLLGRLLAPPPGYGLVVGVFAAVGAVLSALGTDFRRWFGLALLGLVATLALDPEEVRAERGRAAAPPALRAVGEAAALVAVGVAVRALPVYPWGPVREAALPAS